jgi:hypothetical protein
VVTEVEIGRLRPGDIDAALALQEANQVGQGGTLSAGVPRTFFEAAMDGMPVIVARRDGRVVGFLESAPKQPLPAAPIVRAMLDTWPGTEDADTYGPVCVAAEERGRGLAAAMFGALRALLPGREGVLFIRSDNAASIRARAKMGIRQVATFPYNGTVMLVLSYIG